MIFRVKEFHHQGQGGAVAEWSKALLVREKINENQKIPGSPPCLSNLLGDTAKLVRFLTTIYLNNFRR